MSVLDVAWHGLRDSFLMAWEVWWALVLGFAISAIVQAWVPRERIEGALSGSGARPIAWSAALGAAPPATTNPVEKFTHDVASPLLVVLALSERLLDDVTLKTEHSADVVRIHQPAVDASGMLTALRFPVLDGTPSP